VTVNLCDRICEIYFKVFYHLLGISNYENQTNCNKSDKNKISQLFLILFKNKERYMPFLLEFIRPSQSKWCGIWKSSEKSVILNIDSNLSLKESIKLNKGGLPDFKLVYSSEDDFSFSRLNLEKKECLNLCTLKVKPQRNEPLSVYDLMDDFFSISYLDAESQAK
jgi:hypothetical protein